MTCLTVGATTALWLNGRLSAATARYAMREPPRDVSEHEVVPRSPPHFSVRSSSVLYMGQGTFFGFMCRCMKGIMKMKIYEELKARGLIAQVTDEEQVRDLVNNGGATFYIGFDCTADSLTAGHFMALTPDEAPPDGRKQAYRPDRRRYDHDRRPVRTHRYEKDAHQGGYRPQRGVLPAVRCREFIEFGEGKAMNDEQRRLAPEAQLHRAAARGRRVLLGQQYAAAPSATSSEWRRVCPSSSSTT